MTERSTEHLVLDAEPGEFAIHGWANIVFVCLSKPATADTVKRLTRVREQLDERHPEGVSVVYVIAERAGLPSAEAREAGRQLMARFRNRRACLAVLIEGQGFWAGAMRAVVTGVRMLVPGDFAMGVFIDIEQLVAWLPERHQLHTRTAISPDELRAVIQQLMAAL